MWGTNMEHRLIEQKLTVIIVVVVELAVVIVVVFFYVQLSAMLNLHFL